MKYNVEKIKIKGDKSSSVKVGHNVRDASIKVLYYGPEVLHGVVEIDSLSDLNTALDYDIAFVGNGFNNYIKTSKVIKVEEFNGKWIIETNTSVYEAVEVDGKTI